MDPQRLIFKTRSIGNQKASNLMIHEDSGPNIASSHGQQTRIKTRKNILLHTKSDQQGVKNQGNRKISCFFFY